MKSCVVCILLFCLSAVYGGAIVERGPDVLAFRDLATELGIAEDADLVEATQAKWLRQAGLERWEVEGLSEEQRTLVLEWAKNQGHFDAWEPSQRVYDVALILGSSTAHMEARLNYLIDQWNKGIRFDKVVWLVGQRPLDGRVDSMLDQFSTESEAARYIWEKSAVPDIMRTCEVVFIDVPMHLSGARPTTKDTIDAWVDVQASSCSALFVSTQPFCQYQFTVIKTFLPKQVNFEVIGPGVTDLSHPRGAAILLDNFARTLYQDAKQ
ncbi:MAG: hypothetical protein SP1CHLAM54_03500 [Chlamydiia bacterium]|nr:hypothetical protein [Chlamydiia bacterium]MCH9615266.1 hypothetical protein [Chlamydiia bacterium]MCH9628412.1 hypothetical protein [Chlamydiia bacterium]